MMDRSVTLSVKGMLTAAVVLLGLLAAYLLGGAGDPPGTAAVAATGAESADAPRTLTMTGAGEASAVPDQVSFSVAVGVTRPELEDSLGEASATMKKVLDALADFGVTKDDMQTTGLSMYPVYDYPNNAPRVLRGYRVDQRARVTVPELGKAGKAVTAAVDAGGNQVRVNNIRLEVADPEKVLGEARDAAVEEATAKAEQYAEATGQELGEVRMLKEVSQHVPRMQRATLDAAELSAYRSASKVPIRAGSDELSVKVRVVWELS